MMPMGMSGTSLKNQSGIKDEGLDVQPTGGLPEQSALLQDCGDCKSDHAPQSCSQTRSMQSCTAAPEPAYSAMTVLK